jgi:GTPase SAR1 family protein
MVGKKVMVLGAVGVGKTSLSRRLALDKFDGNYKATIGVEVHNTTAEIEGDETGATMPFVLWDIDGDFGLHIFAHTYMRGASAAVVIADASRPATIPYLEKLVQGFKDMLPGRPCAAILNKVDLLPAPPAMSLGDYGSPDFAASTSALTGYGVRPTFAKLAATILRRGL